ncbi:Ribonuclease P protein subunit p29 [Hypsizygus marmoreus]|uniref:Ribonuclease P protein subunit p29 n=1 Tax=Hypsizygus marmoreus TaxID=39966 RepID=A0A369JR56_HYPMA|nr:Ribonuclease P protein subunit p29 [Hypsizygus marmoreus]
MEPESSKKRSQETIDIYKDLGFIKNKRIKLSSNAPFTPTYVISQLTQSSDPAGMYASRVQGRQMLLENPARESRAKKQLDQKRARQNADKEKSKKGIIGKREAKEKGVWRMDAAQAKFDLFLPLHHLWMGYMSELLGLPQRSPSVPPSAQAIPSSSTMHPKLVKADFHGSIITVRQSKNPCLVGLSGIIIHETENAFKIVTSKDTVKLIPKENSIFAFAVPLYSTLPPTYTPNQPLPIPSPEAPKTTVLQAPHIEFELHGNQFRFRSAERAGRKFKHKETIEL